MSFDDYIFVRPSFLRGVARAIDVGGALSRDSFVISGSPAEADRRALESDWRVVNRDVNKAFASGVDAAKQEA